MLRNAGVFSYNPPMTDRELWIAIGETLSLARIRRGFNVTDVEAAGGPNYATVQKNERGDIGRVEKLSQHAHALGLSAVDVLRSILLRDDDRKPISPEAQSVIAKFEKTTVAGRAALVALASALPEVETGPPEPTPGVPEILNGDRPTQVLPDLLKRSRKQRTAKNARKH